LISRSLACGIASKMSPLAPGVPATICSKGRVVIRGRRRARSEREISPGYVEQAYSQGPAAPIRGRPHQAGIYVIPSAQTVAADAAQKPAITPADFSIVNQPGAASYPISGHSWALVYTRQPSQATNQALVTMLDWLTHDGQAYTAANDYVPVPAQVQQLARAMLQQITGPTVTRLLS
jgi:phosphate transport system substrate-binding protein